MTEPTYQQACARFVRETTPTEEDVGQARGRLRAAVGAEGSVFDAGTEALDPAAGAEARVGFRVRKSLRDRRGRRWSPGWLGVGPVSPWRVPALAMALLLGVWLSWEPAAVEPEPEVVDAPALAPASSWRAPQNPAAEPPSRIPPVAEPIEDGSVQSEPAPDPGVPPEQPRPPAVPSADAPREVLDDRVAVLDAVGESALVSFSGWTSAEPDPRVRLRYRGEGALDAAGDDLEIRWQTGGIEVDVSPASGIRLAVVTPEARVAVVGTAFRVDAGASGTRVTVTHGVVSVRCSGAAARQVTKGESAACAPIDPRRLVMAAVTLHRTPGRCEDVLAAIDSALDAWPSDGPVLTFGQALWTRVECLDELGRRREAKEAAEQYLLSGLTGRKADAEAYVDRWQE